MFSIASLSPSAFPFSDSSIFSAIFSSCFLIISCLPIIFAKSLPCPGLGFGFFPFSPSFPFFIFSSCSFSFCCIFLRSLGFGFPEPGLLHCCSPGVLFAKSSCMLCNTSLNMRAKLLADVMTSCCSSKALFV